MTGRVFSLVAIPLAFVGHLFFWPASAQLLRSWQVFQDIDPWSLVLALVGALLVAAAVGTVAFGSLGAIVVGTVQLVFSLLVHLAPMDLRSGAWTPGYDVINALRSVNLEISDGMFFYFPPGWGAVTGAVLLGAGLAAGRRSIPAGTRARVMTGAAAVPALVGLVLVIAAGARVYTSALVTLSGIDPVGLVLLYVGVVLIGAVVAAGRWSSAGVVAAGAVTTLAGFAGLAAPAAVVGAVRAGQELSRGVQLAAPSGILLLVGLTLLAAGIAVRVRARRAIPASVEAIPASM